MQLVVDANVLFAALLKDSTTRRLMLAGGFSLATPEFVIEEFDKHLDELCKRTSLTNAVLQGLLKQFIDVSGMEIIPKGDLQEYTYKAGKISPDPDDVQYFALALKLGCAVWSNEKKLKEQSAVKVFSTEDLVDLLNL